MVRKLPFMRPLLSAAAFSITAAPGIIRETLLDSAGAAAAGVPRPTARNARPARRFITCAVSTAIRYPVGRPAKPHFNRLIPNRFTNVGGRRYFLV